MYTVILLVLLALAAFLVYRGVNRQKNSLTIPGIILGAAVLLVFWFMGFWGEKLWFDQLGYNDRFWTVWISRILLFAGTFILGGALVYLLTIRLSGKVQYLRTAAVLTGAVLSGLFWGGRWETVLMFIHRTGTGISEPVLGMDTGFYLFTLPFLQAINGFLVMLVIIPILAYIFPYVYMKVKEQQGEVWENPGQTGGAIFILGGIFFLVLAFGRFLARYELLFSDYGIVSGPGWTDIQVRLPMLWVVALLTILVGLGLIIAGNSPTLRGRLVTRRSKTDMGSLALVAGGVFAGWFLLLSAVPSLFQWLKVEPNEITLEQPYIKHNIEFTRAGYHLDKVESKEFSVSDEFNRSDVENNQHLFSNIRLWDYRALDAVFKQFQEIRLYYEFHDVDIDRYTLDSTYRQVMVSGREMQPGNLPLNSQTFVNKHFKYTHGYGAVLNQVNEFTPEGLPDLLIKDIPPVTGYDELTLQRPEIYYGELTDDFVVVNSSETEFDYPSGDKNIYAHYQGTGGVPVSSLWRKFLYGWKYGGTRFLLSSYTTRESRLMIKRNIMERTRALTPFLSFDDDPYLVLANGKLYWIIDAYTTSGNYPYSEPFVSFENARYLLGTETGIEDNRFFGAGLRGENYIRNSVKIVVDAYNGDTDFYMFEEDDPLINVYDAIFPGLLKKRSEMPEALRSHVRYPADMLLAQGLVYGKYHMTDPTVFYNQEDLWVRATEKYYSSVQPVEPYYIMWEPPGSDEMEFVLILPFTPKNKQVMIGWIAGMCDDENYGRFLAYQFPKEKRVLGTQQVETKIDQDSYLSGQLTLWDQRGSNVIRGNVLAIPINNTMIYVEPIYLQSETSAYPELRLVAVMHNDNLSYAETFEEALNNLFTEEAPGPEMVGETAPSDETTSQLINRANEAFESYLQFMQQKEFRRAGDELQRLENALQQLQEQQSPQAPSSQESRE